MGTGTGVLYSNPPSAQLLSLFVKASGSEMGCSMDLVSA